MEPQLLKQFRNYIAGHRDNLVTWLNSDSKHINIPLGEASPEEVAQVVSLHDDALDRIDKGDFGKCVECGGEIEPERLELDFTTCVCLDHYSEEQKRTLERDLELAAKVQRQLLPHQAPVLKGAQAAAYTEPAQVVGGDYFDFFSYPDGAQGIAIGDVMGKGLSASMLMSNLQASLRILGPEYDHLPLLAYRLNELFRNNLRLISFISLFLARLDLNSRLLHYCNAGHNPALWWNAASNSFQWLKPTGPALGLTRNPQFKSQELQCAPGDILLFYTDGLVEARNSSGEEFGKERTAAYAREHSHLSANLLLTGLRDSARKFAGKFDDDVTLLVIKLEN